MTLVMAKVFDTQMNRFQTTRCSR